VIQSWKHSFINHIVCKKTAFCVWRAAKRKG